MLDDAAYVLVVGVVRVDEGRLLRGVIIVLVLVFLGLSDLKYFSVTEKYFNTSFFSFDQSYIELDICW